MASRPGFARITADAASDVAYYGAPGLEVHPVPALFGEGLPSLILNMEGMHRASDYNHAHTIELAKPQGTWPASTASSELLHRARLKAA